MSQSCVVEPLKVKTDCANRLGKNGQPHLTSTSFPELLIEIRNTFSVDKAIREVACDLCKIVLTRLNEWLDHEQIDICAIFGFIEEFDILKLKGAAGFQPYRVHWNRIKVGDGIIGQVAQNKRPISTKDFSNDPRAIEIEKTIVPLADKMAVLAYPLILANGEVAGVLLLGKFHTGSLSGNFFWQPGLIETIEWLAMHLATTFDNAKWANKARLLKKHLENERRINAITKQFYSDAILDKNLKLMEAICNECMGILNSGNPRQPFYQNFLFYEYQEYRKRFVLCAYKHRPRAVLLSFRVKSRYYKDYVQDGQVKCLESQVKLVQNRGKYPYIVRYLFENKIEDIKERLDANWSPAAHGTAFIVPLFEDARPLGVLVFWSRKQNRQYVNQPPFYLGPEKRTTGLHDLKLFRSLQPLIASEYYKLKSDEERRRRIVDLENLMGALNEVILIEEKNAVLDRLAEFTVRSLNAEGCLIHLVNPGKSQLRVQATAGFHADDDLKKSMSFSLKRHNPNGHHEELPIQIFETQKETFANSDREFRRRSGNLYWLNPFFKQLKSGKVTSYMGWPIGSMGVIEVFNISKLTSSGWSFFEEHDAITLRHIADSIATVLNRIEATATQVQSEKIKATNELLLDISHELKNPLYSSLIFVRKLKASINGRLNCAAEQEELQTFGLIERNIEKAQKILQSMHSSQKIMMGQMNLEVVNLEKIIRIVLQTNELICEQQRITIGSELSAHQPLVYGDELQLNQVFTNLVKNAIDAMPHGGMLIVRLYELDGALRAEIADTGSGIPEAVKDRVFEPFVTTKDSDNGTGLGLALSQRIINQHDGKIEFETMLDWGTKFSVTLPKFVE